MASADDAEEQGGHTGSILLIIGLLVSPIGAMGAVVMLVVVMLAAFMGAGSGSIRSCDPTQVVAAGSNVATAVKFFTTHGLTLPQAAGLIGNLQVESGPTLDPRARNSLGYRGIGQWDPKYRWPMETRFAKHTGKSPFDLGVQLRYVAWELGATSGDWPGHQSPYQGVLERLKKAGTANSAAEVIFAGYENPGDGSLPKRQEYARAVVAAYKGKTAHQPGAAVPVSVAVPVHEPAGSGGVRVPIVGKAVVTSLYGMRENPGDKYKGRWMLHDGVDLAESPRPTTVVSATAGTVKKVYTDNIGTNIVLIDAGGGVQLGYYHLASFVSGLKAGQKVKPGTPVGVEGATGNVTGPHLHFQVHVNGKPTDPRIWMRKKGVTIPGKGGTITGDPAGAPPSGGPNPAPPGKCSSTPSDGSVSALQTTVLRYAWPRSYPDGHLQRTASYAAAIAKARKAGRYYGALFNPTPPNRPDGDDCGAFVTTLIHDSGWDKTYNHNATVSKGAGNTTVQLQWLQKHWHSLGKASSLKLSQLKPGDVGISASGGFNHVWVYVGKIDGFSGEWAEASQVYGDGVGYAPMARAASGVLYSNAPTATYFRKP